MALCVWRPDVDFLFMASPDVLVQLAEGHWLKVHSSLLSHASPVLAEWIAEFLPTQSQQCSNLFLPPASPGLTLPATTDNPDAWRRVIALLYPDIHAPTTRIVATPNSQTACLPEHADLAESWRAKAASNRIMACQLPPHSPTTPLSPPPLSPASSITSEITTPTHTCQPKQKHQQQTLGLFNILLHQPILTSITGGPAFTTCHVLTQSAPQAPAPPNPTAVTAEAVQGSSHVLALATWDDVEKVYRLAHKYCMQGILDMCRSKVLKALQVVKDVRNEDVWPPAVGGGLAAMQARYHTRMHMASSGVSMTDPEHPCYVLRWLALAVEHHDVEMEKAVLAIAQDYMPGLVTKTWPSTAANARFLQYWEVLGHTYTLKNLLGRCCT